MVIRALVILFWTLVIAALLWPLVRRMLTVPRRRPPALRDELVKDPVCQTYVVRSRAVRRLERGEPVYFCSAECAERYAAGAGG